MGIVLRKLRPAGWMVWISPEQAQTEFRGRKYLVELEKWTGQDLDRLGRNKFLG